MDLTIIIGVAIAVVVNIAKVRSTINRTQPPISTPQTEIT